MANTNSLKNNRKRYTSETYKIVLVRALLLFLSVIQSVPNFYFVPHGQQLDLLREKPICLVFSKFELFGKWYKLHFVRKNFHYCYRNIKYFN